MNWALKVIKHIFVFIFMIFIIVLFISISPIVLIFLLYQQFIVLLSKIFRKDLNGQLHTMVTLIGADYLYCKPYHAPILIRVDFSESQKLEDLKNLAKSIMEKKNPNGSYKYKVMRQTIESWLGVMFWKKVPNFNPHDYIEEMNLDPNSDTVTKILNITFEKGKSPWKVFVTNERKSLWIYFHHCLGDGYSIVKLAMAELIDADCFKDMDKSPLELFDETAHKFRMTWFRWIMFSFIGIYHLAKVIVSELPSARRVSGKVVKELSETYPLTNEQNNKYSLETSIQLDFMKRLRTKYNCSFTSLILAGISGALRNINLKYNLPNFPNRIKMFITLPLPRGNRALENRDSINLMSLPLKISDPVDRIKYIEKHYHSSKFSTFPLAMFYAVKTFMLITPLPVLKMAVRQFHNLKGSIITNVPAPNVEIKAFNKPVKNLAFYVGTWNLNLYIVCGVIGFKDQTNASFHIDRALMPYPEVENEFIKYFHEELHHLDKVKKSKEESILEIEK